MKVTKVWVKEFKSGALLGFADIHFSLDKSDETHLIMKGFKLFEGEDGIELSFPSKKDEKGKLDEKTGKPIWYSVVTVPYSEEKTNPIGMKFKNYLRKEVEKAYKALQENNNPPKKDVPKDFVGDDDIPF